MRKSTKKNVVSKKSQKQASNGKEEESNYTGPDHGQSSSSYSSEDDNASQESNGGATSETKTSAAVNLNAKTRASRGSATDPQSLYARVITLFSGCLIFFASHMRHKQVVQALVG